MSVYEGKSLVPPVRHFINHANEYQQKANRVKDELLSFGYDFKEAQQEFTEIADKVYTRATLELGKLNEEMTEQEVEANAINSLINARNLLTDAAVELTKSALLLSTLPIRDRIQAKVSGGHHVIEGEVVK